MPPKKAAAAPAKKGHQLSEYDSHYGQGKDFKAMRAWFNTRRGPFEQVLKLQDVEKPITSRSRPLRVKVKAVALNPVDHKLGEMMLGIITKRPGIPCVEFSGVVDEGEWDGIKEGDEVCGLIPVPQVLTTGRGALAEFVDVSRDSAIVRKPSKLSFVEAAGLGTSGCTALGLIRKAGLKKGTRVLVNGGSTGAGSMAVQLAKAKGAYVVTTCSKRSKEMVSSLGADEVIDYEEQPLAKHLSTAFPASSSKGFDCVFDTVGVHSLFNACPGFLKKDGVYIDIAGGPFDSIWSAIAMVPFVASRLLWPAWLGGVNRRYIVFNKDGSQEVFDSIMPYFEDGQVKPKIDSTYPFEQAVEAFKRLKSHRAQGKVVIELK